MKFTTKKSLAIIVTFMFSLSLVLTNGAKGVSAETKVLTDDELRLKSLDQIRGKVKVGDKFSGLEQAEFNTENVVLKTDGSPEETIRVIVEVEGEPAISKFSTIDEDNIDSVIDAQEKIQTQVEDITDNEVKNSYGNLINGFSIDIKRKDIDEISSIPGVIKVTEASIYYPTMATAVDLTQAKEVWESYGYKGEGLVVAIIDTGIDYNHKDMRLSNSETAKISAGDTSGPGKYYSDKVPYGYNFADGNDEVIDTTGSMHGMHVAGIVGANAIDDDLVGGTGIRGVAPEAQLLAMKVFTNDPSMSGAYSDDIIAAIEDSVLHGADIINMSLGSPSGYKSADDPEQRAIKNATDSGTICVVSAGNSSYSTDPYWFGGIKDISTAGTPGLAEDALQVASYENTYVRLQAFKLFNGDDVKLIGHTTADINPADVFEENQRLEVVHCGLGKPEEIEGKNLAGKVALIERGEIAFTEKALNAQAKGAVAAIIYNDATSGDAYINMQTDPSINIPYIFIGNTDGVKIKDSIKDGGTVEFGYYETSVLSSDSGKLSSFTSWGPAPNLDFAPQITGPGGNIYSTLNNDTYGSKSGTSMSSPHVAGATALIVQALKESGFELEDRELVEFVKNSIINTAEVLYDTEMYENDDEVPYSPRRQGAGMLQTRAAIDNRVLALGDDGRATISLKEIGNETTFNITLTNYGESDETYNINIPAGVLTTVNPGFGVASSMVADEIIEGATLKVNENEVTVPANGQATVIATLIIPEGVESNIFAEGFIKFVNKDKDSVSLVVPYMGFYGDWSYETIINDVAWDFDEANILPASFAAVQLLGEYNYAGFVGQDEEGGIVIDPNIISISPNNDELADSLIPALYPLRNAKYISVDVLDKDGNLLAKNVNFVQDVRKKIFNTVDGSGQQASIMPNLLWDGSLYNKSTGKYEVVQGQYYVRLNSKVDLDTAKEQSLIIPVKVDTQEPEVTITSSNKVDKTAYELKFELSDDLSGLQSSTLNVAVNDSLVDTSLASISGNEVTLNIELDNNSINTIEVGIYDNAYNFGYESMEVVVGEIPYEKPTLTLDLEEGQEFTESNNITATGKVTGDYGKVMVAGKEINPSEDGTFSINLILEEGRNYIPMYLEDIFGEVIINYSRRVYCDTQAPVVRLESPMVQEGNVIVTPINGIVLRGTVSDNTMGYNFDINGERILTVSADGLYGHDITIREFCKELEVSDGDIITFNAVDLFGNTTVETYNVKVDENAPIVNFIDNETNEVLVNNGLYNRDITPVVNVSEGFKVLSTKLNEVDYDGTAITEDGKYTLVATIVLDREIEEKSVEDTVDYVINFEIDRVVPVVTVDGVVDSGIYNHEVTPVVKVNEESTLEYKLNGEAYELNTISEEGKYNLDIIARDKVGNISTASIAFVIDKTAPVITINDVINGMKYDKEVKPTVSVDDENAEVVLTLNDNPYDGSIIKEEGKYILKVVATDVAGNVTEKVVSFEIKFPEKDTTNPTPVPKPEDNGGSGIDGRPTNDDKGNGSGSSNNGSGNKGPTVSEHSNIKPSTNIKGKGNLPNTGQDRVIYIAGLAVVLVIVGGILVIKKKKDKEEK